MRRWRRRHALLNTADAHVLRAILLVEVAPRGACHCAASSTVSSQNATAWRGGGGGGARGGGRRARQDAALTTLDAPRSTTRATLHAYLETEHTRGRTRLESGALILIDLIVQLDNHTGHGRTLTTVVFSVCSYITWRGCAPSLAETVLSKVGGASQNGFWVFSLSFFNGFIYFLVPVF